MNGSAADSGSALSYPHRSGLYSYRVPSPPRIVVPPPPLDAKAIPIITLHALGGGPGYDFLKHVDYANVVQQNAPIEWTYERRREAQSILPFLSLGPMTAARDEAWLAREGITMLLGVRQPHAVARRLTDAALHSAEARGLETHAVELAGNADLIAAFPRTASLISAHLARVFRESDGRAAGRVLVFCESGNERGAAVVAAFLMEAHSDVDHIKAMQLCQAQRFCVNFDDTMKSLLQSYWDILCAQRAVADCGIVDGASDGAAVCVAQRIRPKRELQRDDDDDSGRSSMELGQSAMAADDMERFEGRTFAPFMDRSL